MIDGFLYQALIYLAAAVICVPVARRLGMGSVLGYLLAGILIGPFAFGFIGREGQDIMHFAEFGVVMMLFLIGLELDPAHFWKMRGRILGMGSLQLGATSLLAGGGLLLLGFSWQSALASGLALSMSSTAIVLQTLREKGLSSAESGRSAFAVLLFQDIAVIPVLAVLPFLAVQTVARAPGEHAGMLAGLPGWLQTSSVLCAILAVIAAGRYVIAPFLRIIAGAGLRELCVAASLLIIFAIAFLMNAVGLSPALGAFLAGVVLANSEFRHELESDIEPFKGLLLGLFFIAVGASINFKLISDDPLTVIALVAALLVLKAFVLILTGRLFRLSFDQNCIFSVALSQVGEFAFVVFAFMHTLKILSGPWLDTMMAVTALSMTVTPVLMLINERLILPSFGTPEQEKMPEDTIDVKNKVIIAGFSTFGSTVGRFLRANSIEATILDNNSDRVNLLRKMGFRVFYGDATRLDILHSAGAADASILIVAIDDPATNCALAATVRKHFPGLTVMVRARNNFETYELLDIGVPHVYRECLDASVRLGVDALVKLGFRRYSATRAGQNFVKYDEAAVHKLAPHRHDEKKYIYTTREQIRLQEQLLANDSRSSHGLTDHAWENESGSCGCPD
ncbi:MAG: cation:proton antiporter [Deltaproteobacteria bacterium]|nr:cation:proton antiporter [Deltaproteobacteria bacterium]